MKCGFDNNTMRGIELKHRHKTYHLFIRSSGALELHMDRCLRKRREAQASEPQYVWTNVELEWEEHHYIEARYFKSRDELIITVNRDEVWRGSPPEWNADTSWLREDEPFE